MKTKLPIIIIAVIFLLGVAGSIAVLLMGPRSSVTIVSGGETVRTIDLGAAPDETFNIEHNGHVNTIEIKDGKIRVIDADCPDKTCVHMGALSSAAMPIVCLPNGLVISYTDAADDVDAVTR